MPRGPARAPRVMDTPLGRQERGAGVPVDTRCPRGLRDLNCLELGRTGRNLHEGPSREEPRPEEEERTEEGTSQSPIELLRLLACLVRRQVGRGLQSVDDHTGGSPPMSSCARTIAHSVPLERPGCLLTAISFVPFCVMRVSSELLSNF
jgi:hypothetical protein